VAEYYQGAGQTITEDLYAVSGLRGTHQADRARGLSTPMATLYLRYKSQRLERLREGKILFQADGAGRHSGPDRESMRLYSEHFSD